MKNVNIMIDLETMSTACNAAICSIGAVKFTLEDGIIDEFYCTVDASDCKNEGLHIDKSTVEWWSKQPKHVLDELVKDTLPLREALRKFSVWYGTSSVPTWGCGAGFDNVILENAYKAVGFNRPWKFWDDRCYRTMKEIIKIPEDVREGTYHNALDDAKHQTKHLLKILGS
jgi:exodeoxyribonuclease VIII